MLNPDDCVNPSVRDGLASTPVQSPATPMHPKLRRKSLNLSPVTPNRSDQPCKQMRKKPNVKVTGRFTRSMVAKVNAIKSPVSNNKDIETVVLDDEESRIVSHDDIDIDHESIIHHVENSPHVSDKNPSIIPVVDPPIKGKYVEVNLPDYYRIGEVVHPLFVNCLLDKIHQMEEEVVEMVAFSDAMKDENVSLKEKSDSADKRMLRLKKHKNKLIRRVLKLQHENQKNEEKVHELNTQVTLMQFKGHSQNPATGVNIQVFNAAVKS